MLQMKNIIILSGNYNTFTFDAQYNTVFCYGKNKEEMI